MLRLQKFAGEKMIRPSAPVSDIRIPWADMKRLVLLPHEAPLPPLTPFLTSPQVDTAVGFLARHLCDYLVMRGLRFLAPATVHDSDAGEIIDPSRSNSFANFRLLEADLVTLSVDARIMKALGHKRGHGDPLSLLQYKEDQTYAPHYDFFDPQFPAHMPHLKEAGQRAKTALVYLNDDYESGHTRFHKADTSFRGAPGDLVAFANIGMDGNPDLQSLHSGEPPTSGIKWILSKWTREAALPL
ncbi:2OG-Fe(II) oxygenase [Kordiimonas gwangyangensis]|nr:2OG-Fe(II) oxygenase [Kordiimonas gwangyangensis]